MRTATFPGATLRAFVVAGWVAGVVALPSIAPAQEAAAPAAVKAAPAPITFDLQKLSQVPATFPADMAQIDGVRTLFYEGVPYHGKPSRVFAYIGLPAGASASAKVPAMVLIHGGGGTAFDRWVKVWTARGYAAISMDLCGSVPVREDNRWQRHEWGGPAGWDASFDQLDEPIEDQWTYHAVSAAALANTLLRSLPEVDADRIGVTGISWGGYLTSIVSGVDPRFRFAVPVYGCGYLGDNSAWLGRLEAIGAEHRAEWLGQWDPSGYLPKAVMPILWVNGTNDFAYPMDSWQKSYRLPKSPRTLCLRIRMQHGHGPVGENPEEIHAFANQILTNGVPLPVLSDQHVDGENISAKYAAQGAVSKAELCFTRQTGRWQERLWESAPATIEPATKRITATIPADAKVFYLNLFDARDCVVSTEHVER